MANNRNLEKGIPCSKCGKNCYSVKGICRECQKGGLSIGTIINRRKKKIYNERKT